jgi:hypothetical protein
LQLKILSCVSTSVVLRCEHKVKEHAAEMEKIHSRKTWRISCFVASQPTNHPTIHHAAVLVASARSGKPYKTGVMVYAASMRS